MISDGCGETSRIETRRFRDRFDINVRQKVTEKSWLSRGANGSRASLATIQDEIAHRKKRLSPLLLRFEPLHSNEQDSTSHKRLIATVAFDSPYGRIKSYFVGEHSTVRNEVVSSISIFSLFDLARPLTKVALNPRFEQ
jgi:hypothetical protein